MNKKQANRLLLYLLILLAFSLLLMYFISKQKVFIGEENQPRDYPEIKNSGTLNIVTVYQSGDYSMADESLQGTAYDFFKFIANRSGLDVNILLENNLEKSIQDLYTGKYDIIARNIPITAENKKQLSFSTPISQGKQVLVQRTQSNDSIPFIKNQIDLVNKIIYVPEHSPVILRLHNLSEEIAEPIHIKEEKEYTAEHLIYRVAYGEIDYAVVDEALARKNKTLFPEIDINTSITFSQWQAWAVRPSSPILLDSLNHWIEIFSKQ